MEYFKDKRILNCRQVLWSQFLQSFNFTINYQSGKLGGKPDALTRRPDVYPQGENSGYANANPHNIQALFRPGQLLANLIIDSVILDAQIITGLRNDDLAQKILLEQESGDPDPHFSTDPSGLLLRNGLVYVPDQDDLRLLVTQSHHDHVLAGHPGTKKTLQNIRRRYWWPQMTSFVTRFVASCEECRRAKAIRHKPFGPLRFLPVSKRPWDSISMDFIEGLPLSDGFDSVLVIVDRLTKMGLFIPTLKTLTTPELAKLFLVHVFSKHGTPSDIVSDRGRHFISRFWASLCELLQIESNLSTAYHPETDGQTEQVNQVLEQYLRIYVNYQQDDWCSFLPLAEFTYNNTAHTATGLTPFFANKGYHPRLTIHANEVPSIPASQTAKDLADVHSYLREQLDITIRQYERATAGRRDPIPPFAVGDLVWLDTRNIKTKRSMKKLDHKRLGPYPITEIVSTHARRLGLPLSLKKIHNIFHVSLLEPHQANPFPGRKEAPPPPVEIDDDLQYEIDEIVDSRVLRGRLYYFVRWQGHDEITREPADVIQEDAPEAAEEYHLRNPGKPGNFPLARG